MTGWRMEFTVLTDLSASIFAACFMILLIFLGLAQKERAAEPPPPARPIEATRDLRAAPRPPLRPAEMVELLYRHGRPGDLSASVDLFADRIEVRSPGDNEPSRLGPQEMARLPALLGAGSAPPRVYIFSNALYGATLAVLGGRPHVELSVPSGLRDGRALDGAWSGAFTGLAAAGLERPAFRARLAVLLAGSAEPEPPAMAPGALSRTAAAVPAVPVGPLAEMAHEFARRVSIGLTLAGFLAAGWIRFRVRDVAFDTSDARNDRVS